MGKIDISLIAQQLKHMYADGAAKEAARTADEMLSHGNIDGYSTWKLIAEAVRKLDRQRPKASEPSR